MRSIIPAVLCSSGLLLAVPAMAEETSSSASSQASGESAGATAEVKTQKKPWLGVVMRALPPVLTKHLGIPDGAGVAVDLVIKDSPAQRAGLRRDDVITHVDGKWVMGIDGLPAMLKEHQVGDEIRMSIRRRNQSLVLAIKLVDRPAKFAMMAGDKDNRDSVFNRQAPGDFSARMNDLMRAQMAGHEDFDRMMAELDAEMAEMRKRAAALRFEAARGGGDQGAMMHYSMTSVDADGRVVISRTDGKTHVKVWDSKGELLFDGPYDTEEEKEKLPESLRARVAKLNVNPTSVWANQGFDDSSCGKKEDGE